MFSDYLNVLVHQKSRVYSPLGIQLVLVIDHLELFCKSLESVDP